MNYLLSKQFSRLEVIVLGVASATWHLYPHTFSNVALVVGIIFLTIFVATCYQQDGKLNSL